MPSRSPLLIPGRTREATGFVGKTQPLLVGTAAVWRTPGAIHRSMPELIAPVDLGALRAHPADVRRAVTVSHWLLGVLARVWPARWRSTCLYRSVAECLVLRALGHPARVVVGVGTDGPEGVLAQAWVESMGIDCLSTRGAAELERMSSRRG